MGMYIGRRDGKVGKINITEQDRDKKMWNFLTHSHASRDDAEILCLYAEHKWEDIMRGDIIPEKAVRAGTTVTDGVIYVGKAAADNEPGKINCERNELNEDGQRFMYNFWAHHGGQIQ